MTSPRLLVVTPSYRRDLELCRDLHGSLQRFGPPGLRHCVIVPHRDKKLFAGIGEVCTVDEVLPPAFLAIPGNVWFNRDRPWPLVRGWVAQQLVKLAATAASREELVLLVDSDMVFVRPFDATTFSRAGVVRFYRAPDAIDGRLPRHVLWHQVARRLLGVARTNAPVLPDYIGWPMSWDPGIVRACLARVEQVTGRTWATAIGGELHFSECVLYGVFVDEVLGGSAFPESRMLSVAYSSEAPLDATSASTILNSLHEEDIAVMISARSNTDLAIRRQAISALASGAA